MKQHLKPSLVILVALLLFVTITGAQSTMYTIVSCSLICLYAFEKYLDSLTQKVDSVRLNEEFEKVRREIKDGIDVAKAEAHRVTVNGLGIGGQIGPKTRNVQF